MLDTYPRRSPGQAMARVHRLLLMKTTMRRGMPLLHAAVFTAAGAALGWLLRDRRERLATGHSTSEPVTERQAQPFVGGPTHELPATPGGYGGLDVP
jgi:hypothetical protein